MKYESAILKRLIDTYGVVGNPRYISEIIKEFIIQGKECYPDLFTYQSDWLAHIDEFGLNPSYTVSYTGQSIYAPNTLEKPVKSAILKGNTGYRDIDTGEILETFEEGRNLELVSVKTPVLTTTGKNLFNPSIPFDTDYYGNEGRCLPCYYDNEKKLIVTEGTHGQKNSQFQFLKLKPNTEYTFSCEIVGHRQRFCVHNESKQVEFNGIGCFSLTTTTGDNGRLYVSILKIGTPSGEYGIKNLQIEEGSTATPYEPYKSNILTVNEDVTLRSNGSVCDELDLLTGKLTQRIDEDGEILTKEVVKTVDLTILDQNGQNVKQLMSFNGGTHFNTASSEGSLLPSISVSVETDLEETLMMCSLEGNTL